MAASNYKAPGLGTVTPYFVVSGADAFIQFLKQAFEAEELERHEEGGGIMHAAMKIGDSTIELGDASDRFPALRMGMHVYVPDADAVYARALAAGGRSLYEVTQHPYGERSGGVEDPFGNQWFIATYTG